MFYDTHAHLNDPKLYPSINLLQTNAKDNHVKYINNVGYDINSSLLAVKIAKEYSSNYAIIGIHPHDANQWNEETKSLFIDLLEKKEENKIVAIGEIGLDYHFDNRLSDEVQIKAFREQMELAYDYKLPVSIHSRDAASDTITLLEYLKNENKLLTQAPGVFHCFSYGVNYINISRKFGFLYGFDGPVTFKNGQDKIELLEYLDLSEILLETDCPYMAPVPYRGKLNQPAYIVEIARKIAAVKNTSVESLAKLTTQNAIELFRLSKYS